MADKIEMTLDGTQGAVLAFQSLKGFIRTNPARTALRSAAKMMQDAIASDAPVGREPDDPHPGRLAENIKVRMRAGDGEIHARVVVQTIGKSDDERNAFYWRFVEFGHATRNGGFVAPQPFITPLVLRLAQYAAQMVVDAFDAAVERATALAKRRGVI